MVYENFNMKEHNFVGHLVEPDNLSDKAVLVIMGGEKSFLPGIKIAERFADYGFIGLHIIQWSEYPQTRPGNLVHPG